MSHLTGEHPGLGCPCRPSATTGSGTKAFTGTSKTSSHIRLWFNTKSDGLRKVSPTGPFTRQTPQTRGIWGTNTLSQLQSISRDIGDPCAVVTTASAEQQRCSALLQLPSETSHTSYLKPEQRGRKMRSSARLSPGRSWQHRQEGSTVTLHGPCATEVAPGPGQCQAAPAAASHSGQARCCLTGLREAAGVAAARPWVAVHRRHSGLTPREWPSLGISVRSPM